MILLQFAHRGEAQAFLSSKAFKPVSFPFRGIYQYQNLLLTITGGGIYSTNQKLSAILGAFHQKINKVINFGIAGSLKKTIHTKQIYSIQKVQYANKNQQKIIFTSSDLETNINCVSSDTPITEQDTAQKLAQFADVVDQELWTVANSCNLFKIPFYSYKLISDYAGENTIHLNFKEQAKSFSKNLLQFSNQHELF